MQHTIWFVLVKNAVDSISINNIRLNKGVIRRILNILQILQVAGIGKQVKIYDAVIGVLVHKQAHHMAADKTGSSGYDDGLVKVHMLKSNSPTKKRVISRLCNVSNTE